MKHLKSIQPIAAQVLSNIFFYFVSTVGPVVNYLRVMTWDHPLSTYAKFSEKLTFLAPHVRVRIRELEILVFRKMLRTYLMDDPHVLPDKLHILMESLQMRGIGYIELVF